MRVPGRPPRGQADLFAKVLPAVQDVVGDAPIIGDFIEIITGREDGTLGDIGSIFNNIFRGIASVAGKVAAIEGKISTGAEYYSDFKLANNASSVGVGWTQGGDGQPLGISDQAAQLTRGGAFATPGRRWAKSPKDASGNDFTVSMVVHPLPSVADTAETVLIARANAAFTEGVCVRMARNKAWLCRFVRTGNTWTYIVITPMVTQSYSPGAIVEFKGQEQVLQVLVNSVVVLAAEDTVHAVDADHRSNGMSQQTTTQLFGTFPQYSGGAASYSIKSQVVLDSVTVTAQAVATKTVAPVAAAVTAGATGAAMPADADVAVYTATKTVADTAATAADAAATAVQQSTTTAIVVQQQQQNQNAGAGGVNKVLTFSGSGALNSTDWTAPASFVVSNTAMALAGGLADGFYLARTNYTFATDDQAVFAQLGAEANEQQTFLCLRASNTGTVGVACRVTSTGIAIGTYSFSGNGSASAGFTLAQSVSRTNKTGDSIEFRAVGNSFVVLVNGTNVLQSTGALGAVGSSNRNSAVIKQKASGAFGIVYYSFNLTSFGMLDFGTVGSSLTNRISARITRLPTSTVPVTINNGAAQVVPNNYFTTTDFVQGMTVSDLSTGAIRADTAGRYEFTAGLAARYTGGQADAWGQTWWCLLVNGSVVSPAVLVGKEFKWPMAAGDVAQPGVINAMVGVISTGNGDASKGLSGPLSINALGGYPGAFFEVFAEK